MNQTSVSRRNFLKGMGAGAGLALMSGYFVEAKESTATTKNFSLAFEHNMQFDTAKTINVWSPLAMPHSFQTPYNLNVTGNFSQYTLNNQQQTPMLYATWEDHIEQKNLRISFDITTYFTKNRLLMPDFQYSSTADRYIRTDGIIADIAQSLASYQDTDSQKAHKIFEWVVSHIPIEDAQNIKGIRSIRQNDGQEIMRGEDISATSVFVAMCRSVGIPAVEAFGLKVDSSRYEKTDTTNTPQAYTRSAVQIGKDWVPNDIILAIHLFHQNPEELHRITAITFNEWDNNWVLFNFSRDVVLDDSRILLSTLQGAYGEIDGTKLSSYDMTHFKSEVLV